MMMETSLTQLVDGGYGGLEQYFTVFTSGDLLSYLLYDDGEVFIFLFIPLSGMSSAVTACSKAAQEH